MRTSNGSNNNSYNYNYNYNYNYSRSSGSGSCYYNSSNYNGSGSNVFSYGNYPLSVPPPPPPKRPPNRLWMKPMEERVHVQGVPGGGDDDSLFKGFPIAFASELWKCSGYVLKKFNFRYREFPCWEDEVEVEGKESGGVDDNVVDKGAGVLYSLAKENVVVSNSMRGGQAKSGGSDRKGCKDSKLSNGDSKKLSMPSLSNKDKGMCRPIVIKRSREELGLSKDHSGKKKIKARHREQDIKKDKGHDSKAVVIHSTSASQAEVYERKAHKVASNAQLTEGSDIEKPKRNAATDEGNLVLRSSEVSGPGCSSEKRVKAEKPSHDCVDSSQKSAETETVPLLDAEKDGVANDLIKKEGVVLDVVGNIQGPISECQNSDLSESKAVTEDMGVAAIENNSEAGKDVETTVLLAATTKSDTSKGGMDTSVSDTVVELDSNGLKLFTEQVPSHG